MASPRQALAALALLLLGTAVYAQSTDVAEIDAQSTEVATTAGATNKFFFLGNFFGNQQAPVCDAMTRCGVRGLGLLNNCYNLVDKICETIGVCAQSICRVVASCPGILTRAEADSLYLTQAEARATYLTQAQASSTFLTQEQADATFLTPQQASDTFLTPDQASATYLTPQQANATFLTQAQADLLYMPINGTNNSTGTDGCAQAGIESAANGMAGVYLTGGECRVVCSNTGEILLFSFLNFKLNTGKGGEIRCTWFQVAAASDTCNVAAVPYCCTSVNSTSLSTGAKTISPRSPPPPRARKIVLG